MVQLDTHVSGVIVRDDISLLRLDWICCRLRTNLKTGNWRSCQRKTVTTPQMPSSEKKTIWRGAPSCRLGRRFTTVPDRDDSSVRSRRRWANDIDFVTAVKTIRKSFGPLTWTFSVTKRFTKLGDKRRSGQVTVPWLAAVMTVARKSCRKSFCDFPFLHSTVSGRYEK